MTPDVRRAATEHAPRVAFQGEPQSASHLVAADYFPDLKPLACASAAYALRAVMEHQARYCMLVIENRASQPIAEILRLIFDSSLHVVGEHFAPRSTKRAKSEDQMDRFLVLAREPLQASAATTPHVTSLVFRARYLPSSLNDALRSITSLEEPIAADAPNAALYYAEVEGPSSERDLQIVLQEVLSAPLMLKVLGTYPASSLRARTSTRLSQA